MSELEHGPPRVAFPSTPLNHNNNSVHMSLRSSRFEQRVSLASIYLLLVVVDSIAWYSVFGTNTFQACRIICRTPNTGETPAKPHLIPNNHLESTQLLSVPTTSCSDKNLLEYYDNAADI